MRFKQAVIEYTLKHGVTTAAIRYKTSRQNIYRWRKKYDGTVHSLAEGSHRPHSHPNQHTEEEIKLVKNIRRRNPHAGLVVFWVKLRQRGYTRSISGPHKLLCRIDGKPVKLPNPKYIPKPYEQMQSDNLVMIYWDNSVMVLNRPIDKSSSLNSKSYSSSIATIILM